MSTISDVISQLRIKAFNNKKKRYDPSHGKKRKYTMKKPDQFISSWLEDDNLSHTGSITKALVVILNTHGCSWARNGITLNGPRNTSDVINDNFEEHTKPGGCAMCGYINDCADPGVVITKDDIVKQFRSSIEKYPNKPFDLVKIFTSGSFLDDNEIPFGARQEILELCNELSISNLLFESRPEFITKTNLEQLTQSFNGRLQVAIGLESANDKILEHSINKGFTFKDYCQAVQNAKELDVLVKTYLLLKPPFLNEQEAITDVLNSIEVLHSKKLTDCISINPVNIQKFTLIEYLFHRNEYRPPWLWSVHEILKLGHELLEGSDIRLLSQPTAGGKKLGVHNCGTCDPSVLKAINDYSLNNDVSTIAEHGKPCECKSLWRDVLVLEQITKNDPLIIPK
jgi:radical SAM enzyme (TIGR01210 family)